MMWKEQKGRGIKAQTLFEKEFEDGSFSNRSDNIFNGCWIVSPKSIDSHKTRLCVFVSEKLEQETQSDIEIKEILGEKLKSFYGIAEFLKNAGLEVAFAIPSTSDGKINFESILKKDFSFMKWNIFRYNDENLEKQDSVGFFEKWEGSGRATFQKTGWEDENLKSAYTSLDEKNLQSMLLHEIFYTGFLKGVIKKPTNDPYDIDGFIISQSKKHILPVEMKEKFPVLKTYVRSGKRSEHYFGIDAGRILSLLRICIPNNANALYIVREVEDGTRNFVKWKYTTLSKIIMSSGWNLQAGGTGMGGGDTQTVRIPYDEFYDLEESTFSEDSLEKISNFPEEIKKTATEFKDHAEKQMNVE